MGDCVVQFQKKFERVLFGSDGLLWVMICKNRHMLLNRQLNSIMLAVKMIADRPKPVSSEKEIVRWSMCPNQPLLVGANPNYS